MQSVLHSVRSTKVNRLPLFADASKKMHTKHHTSSGDHMKKIALALLVTLPLTFGTAFAEDKKPTAQQSKMKTCNATAKEKALKGAERKAFMSECLKKK
jgi:psiF repeat